MKCHLTNCLNLCLNAERVAINFEWKTLAKLINILRSYLTVVTKLNSTEALILDVGTNEATAPAYLATAVNYNRKMFVQLPIDLNK